MCGLKIVLLQILLGAVWFAQPSAASPSVLDADDGLLPRDIIPYHYDIDLTPDFYQSSPPFTFNGTVVIWFECVSTTLVATLNIDPEMTVLGVSLAVAADSPFQPPSPIVYVWEINADADFLNVMSVNDFVPGARYTVTVSYSSVVHSLQYGLYYDWYTATDGSTKYILATQLEDIDARGVFPCFDEPDLKATFNVTVAYKAPFTALSNMPVVRTDTRSDGWLANVYDKSPVMSTYQVCVCIGELDFIETDWVGSYPIRVYFRPDMASQMAFPASIAPLVQAWFESETGILYPLPKLDHIALPNKGGAMENWGLITYGEQYFASNPETNDAFGAQYAASFIAHEVAHQWFGNLVTMEWWDDIWLNEGFATYYDYIPLESVGWSGRAATQRDTQYFLFWDARNDSDPVRKTIYTPWDAWYSFEGSTYPKGGAMVTMLEAIIGSAGSFRTAISNYLNANQYSSVTTDVLWQHLTDQSVADGNAVDIKSIMDPWLNQMGFPVLTVSRHPDGTAVVTQDLFLHPPNQKPQPSPYNYKWTIPLTVVTADSAVADWDGRPTDWLTDTADTLTLTGLPTDLNQWVIVNPKQRYYYRVNYDADNLAAIASQFNSNHELIDELSRAQVIDDAFALSRTSYILETSALELTRYLSRESSLNPWNAAIFHLATASYLYSGLDWYSNFSSYIASKTFPVYDTLGWTYNSTEHPDLQQLRQSIAATACNFGSTDCLQNARSDYSTYIANPSVNSIDPNNLQTVLCNGVYEGTFADWGAIFTQYQNRRNSQMYEERYAYVCALSCTSDPDMLDRLLTYIVGGVQIAPRDQYRAAVCMLSSQTGQQRMLDYLANSWLTVPAGMAKWSLLLYITNRMGTQAGLDRLNTHIAINPPQNYGEWSAYNQFTLTVKQNINWLATNQDLLGDWFANSLASDPTSYRVESPRPFTLMVDTVATFDPEERQKRKASRLASKNKKSFLKQRLREL